MSFLQERRKFGRRDDSAQGWIRVRGRPKILCTIRSLTPNGAFLECARPPWLPFRFELTSEDARVIFNCEIRHALDNGIGVHFVGDATEGEKMRGRCAKVIESDEWLGAKTVSLPQLKRTK